MLSTKYAEMTRDEAIKAILKDYPDAEKAMSECFREGFLRGEQFAKEYYPCKAEEVRRWESDEITGITCDVIEK